MKESIELPSYKQFCQFGVPKCVNFCMNKKNLGLSKFSKDGLYKIGLGKLIKRLIK